MPPISAQLTRLLKATSPAVYFAPGSTFFTRRLDLPAEIEPSEVGGYVELSLEDLSPFPTEQLYYGYVVAADRETVFVYAAYRRRFPIEVTRTWADQAFVVPDFLPLLGRTFDRDTTLFLETGGEHTIMAFRAGQSLPDQLMSRPAPETEDEEALTVWRENLRQVAVTRGLIVGEEKTFAGTWEVQESAGSLVFRMQADDEASSDDLETEEPILPPGEEPDEPTVDQVEVSVESDPAGEISVLTEDPPTADLGPTRTIPLADLWAMDIRDPDFLAGHKQSARIDGFIWRGILGIAAALMILLAGEVLLVSGKVFLGVMDGVIARRQGEVVRIEERDTIVQRLAEFDRSDLIPFEMLRAINAIRPRSVYFTRAATEGLNNLVISAWTQNVSDVNQYEAGLRALPEVQGVEVRNLQPRDDGTTFTLVVTFRPGAFEAALKTASR